MNGNRSEEYLGKSGEECGNGFCDNRKYAQVHILYFLSYFTPLDTIFCLRTDGTRNFVSSFSIMRICKRIAAAGNLWYIFFMAFI